MSIVKKTAIFFIILSLLTGAFMLVRHRKAQLVKLKKATLPILTVTVEPVRYGTFWVKKRYLGILKAKEAADISAQITAKILAINVREGDQVYKDQLLVLLDDRIQKNKIAHFKAELISAQTTLKTQEAIYKRRKKLFKAHAISKEALEQAKTARDAAKAKVISLKTSLKNAKIELSYTKIRAPFDGIITARFQNPGEIAIPQKPILRVEAFHKGYTVVVKVPQDVFPSLKVGTEVIIKGERGYSSIKAIISRLYPATSGNVLPSVEIDLKSPPFSLPTGSMLEVELIIGKKKGFIVPTAAVLEQGKRANIFVVDKTGRVKIMPVTIVARGEKKVCVIGKLKPSALVVTAEEDILLKLHQGQLVRFVLKKETAL